MNQRAYITVSFSVLTLAIVVLALMQALGSVRFWTLNKAFSISAPIKETHRVNINSLAGGFVFFNFLGQGITRTTLFRSSREASSLMFFITAIERVMAFASLAFFTTLILLNTSVETSQSLSNLNPALLSIMIAVLIGCLVFYSGTTTRRRKILLDLTSIKVLIYLFFAAALTIATHFFTLLAFIVVATWQLNTDPSLPVALASLISMLAGSFPVMPGGWGTRELGSAAAFSQIGFTPFEGVKIAFTIGLLSLGALLIHLLLVNTVSGKIRIQRISQVRFVPNRNTIKNLTNLIWIVPFPVFILVAFQTYIDIDGNKIALNLADPFAVLLALTSLALFTRNIFKNDSWNIKYYVPGLVLLGLSVCLAFGLGYFRHGLINWALVNRFAGLGIVFSFLFSGAFISWTQGTNGIKTCFNYLALLSCSILVLEFSVRIIGIVGYFEFSGWVPHQYSGFLVNRNAWAFFVLLSLVSYATMNRGSCNRFLCGIMICGALLTASRTAHIILAVLFVAQLFGSWTEFKRLLFGFLIVLFSILIVNFALPTLLADFLGFRPNIGQIVLQNGLYIEVDAPRWETYVRGWTLFLQYPLFGAGLGVNMLIQQGGTEQPLVIHSTFIWLLAEFGIVGTFLFLLPIIAIIWQWVTTPKWLRSRTNQTLLLCLIVAGLFGLAHDMAYQRIFWFLLGLLVATPSSFNAFWKTLSRRSL